MKKTIIRLSVILFLSGFFVSYEKEIRSSIPSFDVFIRVDNLFPTEFTRLQSPNSAVSFPIPGAVHPADFEFGFGGVLIYRDLDGKIRSCDLACPVEALPTVRVEVNMPFAVCPVCDSKFDLSWGFAAPVSGPAREPLRRYYATDRATSIVASN